MNLTVIISNLQIFMSEQFEKLGNGDEKVKAKRNKKKKITK
jgi:hypothetical protein